MRYTLTLLTVPLVLALSGSAFASAACNCKLYGIQSPTSNSTNVPTNLKIFAHRSGPDTADVTLAKGIDGEPGSVPAHLEEIGGLENAVWLVPDALLEPNTTYEWIRYGSRNPFTTGALPDTTPPNVTSASIAGTFLGGACEPHIAAGLEAMDGTDETTPSHDLIWRVTLKSPAHTIHLGGDQRFFGRMLVDDPYWTNCLLHVPDVNVDTTYEATIVAVDWAGNVSNETSNTFQFMDPGPSCGCRMDGTAFPRGVGTLGLAVAAAVLFRRRSRPKKEQI